MLQLATQEISTIRIRSIRWNIKLNNDNNSNNNNNDNNNNNNHNDGDDGDNNDGVNNGNRILDIISFSGWLPDCWLLGW